MICNKRKYFTVPEVLVVVAPQNSMLLLIQKSTPACFDDEKKYHILTFYHHHWVVAAAKGSAETTTCSRILISCWQKKEPIGFLCCFFCVERGERTLHSKSPFSAGLFFSQSRWPSMLVDCSRVFAILLSFTFSRSLS